jgi:hypothetical protein
MSISAHANKVIAGADNGNTITAMIPHLDFKSIPE